MTLADYYFHDPRLVLVPIEHLAPRGMSREFAALVAARAGWMPERIRLFDAAFTLYWERTASLAGRTRDWRPPRLRHVAVVRDPRAIRPYVQLLNTNAWTLYEGDLDPTISHPEFVAYLLVYGDRMAWMGEVTMAALHDAAYWFERTKDERAAFAQAAERSPRPDAPAFQALAAATSWLSQLRHETLRPPLGTSPYRRIPGTGLLVPAALEAEPQKLVAVWTEVATRAVQTFHASLRTPDPEALPTLCAWLAGDVPKLLITAQRGRIVWDPAQPGRLGALRAALRPADGAALREIDADLRLIDQHSRAFHVALADPSTLPAPDRDAEQSGYTYLHCERRLIAYNLYEPGMERLRGPALPYARAMLGARTVHEWSHLAAAAGWIPLAVSAGELSASMAFLADEIEAVIGAAPSAVRRAAEADLAELAGGERAGEVLARLFLQRMPDYQANLVARRFLAEAEQETYVRQNVRTLRNEYLSAQLWRMLIRYLYEYQYLAFSRIPDARTYFLRSTWFDDEFFATGVLDDERFRRLVAAGARLCASYAVDETRFRAGALAPNARR